MCKLSFSFCTYTRQEIATSVPYLLKNTNFSVQKQTNKQSDKKAVPFWKRVTLSLRCTLNKLCPVAVMPGNLVQWDSNAWQLSAIRLKAMRPLPQFWCGCILDTMTFKKLTPAKGCPILLYSMQLHSIISEHITIFVQAVVTKFIVSQAIVHAVDIRMEIV